MSPPPHSPTAPAPPARRASGRGREEALRHYALHGVAVEVASEDGVLLERLDAVLRHYGLVGSAGAGPGALRLSVSALPGVVSVPAGAEETARHQDLRAWRDGGTVYLACDGHTVRIEPSAGRAEAVVPASAGLRKDVLIYALLVLLRRRGLYGLHASAVSRAGRGCLFVASCGGGKSTSTYALVRSGWSFLGDDALLLRAEDDGVSALALRRDLCLAPDLADVFPEVLERGDDGPFATRGKRRLSMPTLYPDRLVERCVPRVCVFPQVVGDPKSRLLPMDDASAMARLIAQSTVLMLDAEMRPRHLEALRRLAGQTSAYRLFAGSDLRREPGLLDSMLTDLGAFVPDSASL